MTQLYLTEEQFIAVKNHNFTFGSDSSASDITKYVLPKEIGVKYSPLFLNSPKIQHIAAYYGYIELLKYLCIQNANNNRDLMEPDKNRLTTIHFAAAGGQFETIIFIADQVGSEGIKDGTNRTIVHYACQFGHVRILSWAYSHKIDLEENCRDGYPIHLACFNQHFDIIEFLCQKKVNVNQTFSFRNEIITPLTLCFKNGFSEAIPLLASAGADFSANDNSWPFIFTCIQRGKLEYIKLLIFYKYDINKKDIIGWTPIHKACSVMNEDIIDLLLENNANPCVRTNSGATPFVLARNKCVVDEQTKILEKLRTKICEIMAKRFLMHAISQK